MTTPDTKRVTGNPPNGVYRTLFAVFVIAFLTIGILLDQIVLPRDGNAFEAFDFERSGIVTLGMQIEAVFQVYLWPLVAVTAALVAMAWRGVLDRMLKPGIAAALVSVLAIGGIAVGTWSANQQLAQAILQQTAN